MSDTLSPAPAPAAARKRVLVLGATGTAGRAAVRALAVAGHEVVALVRRVDPDLPGHVEQRAGDVTDPAAVARDGLRGEAFDAVLSCLTARSGGPKDAWALDYQAQSDALAAARAGNVGQFILLSAICVQKPMLEFQCAKLAFEAELIASGLTWSIVRPTAFFKSLSGQLGRVKAGKPFLVFGDGTQTACKPISDGDLGRYLAACLTDPDLQNRVLPVGGPGPAITPLDQAAMLSDLMGREVAVRRVPVALMSAIIAVSSGLGRVSAGWAERAEFARIARYYATESMLVWDEGAGRYDADATPEFGTETLAQHYAGALAGDVAVDLREHAVF